MAKLSLFKPIHIVVDNIPKWPLLYWPFYYLSTSITVLDNSVMSASSKTSDIETFVERLRCLGLANKVKRCAIHDFDQARWQANSLSVRFLEFQYRDQRQKFNEWRYFSGYIAHRQTETIARLSYLRKVRRQLKQEVNATIWIQQSGKLLNCLNTLNIFAVFFGLIITLIMPILFIRLLWKHCNWVYNAKTESYSGVAVDHAFGIKTQDSGGLERTSYHDGFLVEDDADSVFYSTALFGYGWSLNTQQLDIERQSTGRFRVFGIHGRQLDITPLTGLKALYRHWIVAFNLIFSNQIKMSCQRNYYVLAYCRDRFLASLAFTELRPAIYLSRLDYSHRHHAIGAACKEVGIHYAGICHSALGGDGYVPQRSIISFDTFFIYSSWFSQHFFPTWSNPFTRLETMGVWRGDFSVQAKNTASICQTAQAIRQQLQSDWVVALHLPVPQAYMFDKTTIDRWMKGFANLITEQSDVAFVLFPRRLEQAPNYFRTQVQALADNNNCVLAETLSPDWQQSYRWSLVCDMVVGCFYSDTVAEALAAGIPALLYTDTGRGYSHVEKFDRSLVAYEVDEIANAIKCARLETWPNKLLWQRIYTQWLGVADGQCIMRMRSTLAKILTAMQNNK